MYLRRSRFCSPDLAGHYVLEGKEGTPDLLDVRNRMRMLAHFKVIAF